MQITKLERELSEYVSEWIDARWQKWLMRLLRCQIDAWTLY